MNQLADLRLALADARAHLRTAKDTYEMARAIAEQAAIERLGGGNREMGGLK